MGTAGDRTEAGRTRPEELRPTLPGSPEGRCQSRVGHDFVPTGKSRLGSNCPGDDAVITPPPLADAGPWDNLAPGGPGGTGCTPWAEPPLFPKEETVPGGRRG